MLEWVAVSVIALGALGYCIARFRASRHTRVNAGCPGCSACEQARPPRAHK